MTVIEADPLTRSAGGRMITKNRAGSTL